MSFDIEELRRASNLVGLPDWAVSIIDKAVVALSTNDANSLSAPLFTRTAYTKEELFAHIDSLEQLGFTSYVIGRDVENVEIPPNEQIKAAFGPLYKHNPSSVSTDRWIIKVYGTEEVE